MVRRTGNLYEKIADPDNLRLAYLKSRRGKSARPSVLSYALDLDNNLTQLRRGLLSLTPLRLGDYRYFMVYDPKPRMICAASFNERVLHHAVMNVCEPVFENYAIFDSYACRRGKGGERAIKRAQHYCRQYPWYLKLDIRKYFDSISHQILQKNLSRRFREKRLLNLFDEILATYETFPGKGLPIGNLISQHLANFYLGRLDHWLQEEVGVKGYLRYMDDFLIFSQDRLVLKGWWTLIETFLATELGLQVKSNGQLNRTICGIPFLGYRVFAQKLRLGSLSRLRFQYKFKLYEKFYEKGIWGEIELQKHVEPLLAFVRKAETAGLRRRVLEASRLCENY